MPRSSFGIGRGLGWFNVGQFVGEKLDLVSRIDPCPPLAGSDAAVPMFEGMIARAKLDEDLWQGEVAVAFFIDRENVFKRNPSANS